MNQQVSQAKLTHSRQNSTSQVPQLVVDLRGTRLNLKNKQSSQGDVKQMLKHQDSKELLKKSAIITQKSLDQKVVKSKIITKTDQPKIKMCSQAPPSKSQANAIAYQQQKRNRDYTKPVQNEEIQTQSQIQTPGSNYQQYEFSLPMSALISPPSIKMQQRQSIGPDVGLMSTLNFIKKKHDETQPFDETNIEEEPNYQVVQAVGNEASAAAINSWSAGNIKASGGNTVTKVQSFAFKFGPESTPQRDSFFDKILPLSSQVSAMMQPFSRNQPQSLPISINNSMNMKDVNTSQQHMIPIKGKGSRPTSSLSLQGGSQIVFQQPSTNTKVHNPQKFTIETTQLQPVQKQIKTLTNKQKAQKYANIDFFENIKQNINDDKLMQLNVANAKSMSVKQNHKRSMFDIGKETSITRQQQLQTRERSISIKAGITKLLSPTSVHSIRNIEVDLPVSIGNVLRIKGESNSSNDVQSEKSFELQQQKPVINDEEPVQASVSPTHKSRNHSNQKQMNYQFQLIKQERKKKDQCRETDDYFQDEGTILSETNEVDFQLRNAVISAYASPSRGSGQEMLTQNEENIMEQTMGRTLTQQKLILQEINSQTSKRQRDFIQPDHGLSTSQILQEDQPHSTSVRNTLKLIKPYKKLKLTRPSLDMQETQRDFSDIEDSMALDEAAGVQKNILMHKENTARGVNVSQSFKSTPGVKQRRLTAIAPHLSKQTKINNKDLTDYKDKSKFFIEVKTNKVEPSQIIAQKQVQDLVMRLANLNHVQGQMFLQPVYSELKQIDLRNNRIQELPREICNLNQLNSLKVDYNYLAALPFSIGNLQDLHYLSASQNKLIELPDSLFRYDSKLQTLLVNDNKIVKIQRRLGSLKSLKQLYLHNNLIVEIPTSFYQLNKIVEFSLDWLTYIEKTQEELEEMQGLKPPSQEVETQLQTVNDQPMSARKYFDQNQDGPNPYDEQRVTIAAIQKTQSDIINTHRNSNRDPIESKPIEAFSLSILGNKKVLKGEKGILIVKEMRLLCKYVDIAQKNVAIKNASEHGMLHFIQFVMYFQQMQKLSKVKDFTYRHKQRTILHQLAINGHVYLLQASIAVLGMNRPQTSFNINKTDEDNSTALVLALRQKRFEFVKYLLRLPQITTTIYSDKYGLPLHVALQQSEFKLALKLLRRQDQLSTPEESVELDVNVPNEQGNTALHLVFMNFNANPELATLVAKMLIKKGANLKAKNNSLLGLLHVSVQAGTTKALKFAVEHNLAQRKKLKLKDDDRGLFQFNMKAGENDWTLLHFAIQATNLAMITFLLNCEEVTDLNARDNQGRRAIDLCPFSSPIFKLIRNQQHRQTLYQFDQTNDVKIQSDVDYSVPLQIRMGRQMIQQNQVFNDSPVPKPQLQKQNQSIQHKNLSARDCFVSEKHKNLKQLQMSEPLQFRFDLRNVAENGPIIKKSLQLDFISNQNFESIHTNQTFEDLDPYREKVLNIDSRISIQQPFQSNSIADSTDDHCFELYNSQAAAYPYELLQKDLNRHRSPTQNEAIETATYIERQPLNISLDSQKFQNLIRDSEVEVDEDEEDFELKNMSGDDSLQGENVEDDGENQQCKAVEARVSQWNRQQSTQLLEEKQISLQKVKLAEIIVNAFENVKNLKDDPQPYDDHYDHKQTQPSNNHHSNKLYVANATKQLKTEQSLKFDTQSSSCSSISQNNDKIYIKAFWMNHQDLQILFDQFAEQLMRKPANIKIRMGQFELEQLILIKSNEISENGSMKLIVIKSTGRHKKGLSFSETTEQSRKTLF